jgi:hypothetical protein
MPLYHFCIRNDRYSGASEPEMELAEQDAACAEMTKVCGGLVGSISRNLDQNAEWQMELLGRVRKASVQKRLVADDGLTKSSGRPARSLTEKLGMARSSNGTVGKRNGPYQET